MREIVSKYPSYLSPSVLSRCLSISLSVIGNDTLSLAIGDICRVSNSDAPTVVVRDAAVSILPAVGAAVGAAVAVVGAAVGATGAAVETGPIGAL